MGGFDRPPVFEFLIFINFEENGFDELMNLKKYYY